MISVKNLSKTFRTQKNKSGLTGFASNIFSREYKNVKAVKDISFDIKPGELVGFLGPNGAGKTTTLKMLSGVLYPTKGKIDVLGYTPFKKNHDYLKQIAFVMGQRSQLLWELPPIDTFKLNQAIYNIPDKEFNETIHTLSELLDTGPFMDQPSKTLSLGQRMKMEIIAALLHRPKVLFLDEPTIGLDVVAQKIIRDFIQEYQRHYESTILLTSHYMEDVRRLAKRIIIIDHGSLIYDGKLSDMVKKYAAGKTVEIIVDDMPKVGNLKKIDVDPDIDFPSLRFKTKRKKVPELVNQITNNLDFTDINVEEEKIENIVRKIFNSSSNLQNSARSRSRAKLRRQK